jgi:uncharacterized protein
MNIDFDLLWKHVLAEVDHREICVHGPDHWRRVERNGLLLATRTGADLAVVRLFALFHDSRRENDGLDPDHGTRGARYAQSLCGKAYVLDAERLSLLTFACRWHTDQHHHTDPTIGTCWDADRLDLGRVGVIPNATYMSTDFGREIAEFGSLQPWLDPKARPGRG